MNRRYEDSKIDVGLVAQALNNTNVTGKFHSLAEFRSALAILSGGHMVKTKTCKMELLQATGADAGGAKAIDPVHECLITANVLVTELTILLASVANGETIEINGLTFSAHTNVEDLTIRQFDISGNDSADAQSLLNCINDPDYGIPGVTATISTATLTLVSTVPGATVITAASSDATFTVVTTKAQSFIDLGELKLDAGFTHIAVKVTVTDTATWCAVVLIRYHPRKKITQKVGASFPA